MRRFRMTSAFLMAFSTLALPHAARAEQIPGQQFVFPFTGTIPCGEAGTCPDEQVPLLLDANLCDAPFPASVASADTVPAPVIPDGKKMIISFTIKPKHDWGAYACDSEGHVHVANSALLGHSCDSELGPDSPLPFGCVQSVDVPALSGEVFHLHAINRLDWTDCPAIYSFVFV